MEEKEEKETVVEETPTETTPEENREELEAPASQPEVISIEAVYDMVKGLADRVNILEGAHETTTQATQETNEEEPEDEVSEEVEKEEKYDSRADFSGVLE